MTQRSSTRMLLGLALAISSLTVLAAPASAATTIEGCNGTCGYLELKDTGPSGPKGAVCGYEKVGYDLDFISVRPPLMHGPYSYKTKVQWQYKIFRSTNFGLSYSLYNASTWQTAMANSAIPAYAGSGFTRRFWYAPESPSGWFKVRIFLRWLNSGGSLLGNSTHEYDHYKGLWNGSSDYRTEYCLQDW